MAGGKVFVETRGNFNSQSAKKVPSSAKQHRNVAFSEEGHQDSVEPLSAGIKPPSKINGSQQHNAVN